MPTPAGDLIREPIRRTSPSRSPSIISGGCQRQQAAIIESGTHTPRLTDAPPTGHRLGSITTVGGANRRPPPPTAPHHSTHTAPSLFPCQGHFLSSLPFFSSNRSEMCSDPSPLTGSRRPTYSPLSPLTSLTSALTHSLSPSTLLTYFTPIRTLQSSTHAFFTMSWHFSSKSPPPLSSKHPELDALVRSPLSLSLSPVVSSNNGTCFRLSLSPSAPATTTSVTDRYGSFPQPVELQSKLI